MIGVWEGAPVTAFGVGAPVDHIARVSGQVRSWSLVLKNMGQLIIDSLVRPRDAARQVLSQRPSLSVLVEAAVAVTCVGMILAFLAGQFNPTALDPSTTFILSNPLVGAVFQLCVLAFAVLFTARVGRFFGGTGDTQGALTVIVWIDFVMVLIQATQIAALVILPPVATFLALAAVIWVVWALASFVAELHGFENMMVVLGGVILSLAVLFFGMAFVLALFTLPLQGIE